MGGSDARFPFRPYPDHPQRFAMAKIERRRMRMGEGKFSRRGTGQGGSRHTCLCFADRADCVLPLVRSVFRYLRHGHGQDRRSGGSGYKSERSVDLTFPTSLSGSATSRLLHDAIAIDAKTVTASFNKAIIAFFNGPNVS
jgi:hypothetical protein